jgi:hypothetical protein
METEISSFVSLLRKTFERGAWHGPSVTEALADVKESDAAWRLPDTHSIIEIVGHMQAWRAYAIQKLSGNTTYTVSDEMNFPLSDNWRLTLTQLNESQRQLIAAIENFPASALMDPVPGTNSPLDFYTLLHGIVHHDLYHTGQIMLIKKANRTQTI